MKVLTWSLIFLSAYVAGLILRAFVQLVTAKILGLDVRSLWFGYGKPIAWRRWRDIDVCLGSMATWAQIGVHPRSKSDRRRLLISNAAGCAVNLAIILAFAPDDYWRRILSLNGILTAGGPIVFGNVILLCLGLFTPSWFKASDSSDPEGMPAESEEQSRLMHGHLLIAEKLRTEGRTERAAQWLYRSLRNPRLRSNLHYVKFIASVQSAEGNGARALDLYREVRAKASRPYSSLWREASDELACEPLCHRNEEMLPEALAVINEAISEFPQAITLLGTRGGIFFELGRFEESRRDLELCARESLSEMDRGISSAYLAALANRAGNRAEAERLANIAKASAGDHPIVQRVLASMELRDTSAPIRA